MSRFLSCELHRRSRVPVLQQFNTREIIGVTEEDMTKQPLHQRPVSIRWVRNLSALPTIVRKST